MRTTNFIIYVKSDSEISERRLYLVPVRREKKIDKFLNFSIFINSTFFIFLIYLSIFHFHKLTNFDEINNFEI